MKRRSYLAWLRIGFALHVGVIALLVGGLFGFVAFQSYLRQWRFEPVQGTILKSAAEPCEDGLFSPEIAFSYTVNHRRYNGGRYRDDFGQVCYEKVEVDAILSKYPQGAVVDAWYDPKNPNLAVLDRSMGLLHFIGLIVAGSLVLVVSLLVWLFIRSRGRSNERVLAETDR